MNNQSVAKISAKVFQDAAPDGASAGLQPEVLDGLVVPGERRVESAGLDPVGAGFRPRRARLGALVLAPPCRAQKLLAQADFWPAGDPVIGLPSTVPVPKTLDVRDVKFRHFSGLS